MIKYRRNIVNCINNGKCKKTTYLSDSIVKSYSYCTLLLFFIISSVAHLEAEMAKAIQQVYSLDSPAALTIEDIGKPTFYEATTQVRWFLMFIQRLLRTHLYSWSGCAIT